MIFEEDLYEGDPRNLGKTLWRVRIDFGKNMPGNESQTAADALEEIAVSIFQHNLESADGDRWEVEMMTLGEPDKADIAQRLSTIGLHLSTDKIIAEPVEQKDWLSHVHDNFPPVVIGNFFVYGSHYAGDIPANLIPLKIDAATAFGSGEHETTRGCLEIMQELAAHKSFSNALDMGCGSGILAIGVLKIWPKCQTTAVDIDPESTRVTARHAEMNSITGMHIETGDGYKSPIVSKNAPYDLIIANILAGPLIDMAPELDQNLAQGGYAVLSGLLTRQADQVIAAHTGLGLSIVKRHTVGEWSALLLKKGG